jgi:hypothetical protein
MHVSMTQGVVSVDISLTADEARKLKTILEWSARLFKGPERSFSPQAAAIEAVSQDLFDKLRDAGVESEEVPYEELVDP